MASTSSELGGGASVGLALDIVDGVGTPLRVAKGQKFYVNQLDLSAVVVSATDEGIDGLAREGDFAQLHWEGASTQDSDFTLLPSPDGNFIRRRFYQGARWMDAPSIFFIVPVDAHQRPTGIPIILPIGSGDRIAATDRFFVRRLHAIQSTNDCIAPGDCAGANSFSAEGIVEVRWAKPPLQTFRLSTSTTALQIFWTERRQDPRPYVIPVEHVAAPPYAYGLKIGVTPVTAPRPDGTYPPGADLAFRVTFRDGAGTRLHPEGSLPTYNEVKFTANPAGLQYYNVFFDNTIVFWRHKHRERMMMAHIIGPAQDVQPIRSIITIPELLGPEDTQTVGLPARDGVFSAYQTFPPSNDLFGGAFDPAHTAWGAPVSDVVTFHIPADAQPGTYLVTVKAKRQYLGEDLPITTTIKVQVGTQTVTHATLTTGPCVACHTAGGELGRVLHGNADRDTCSGCHAPLPFEYNAPVYVRVHYLHSRSGGRYEANLKKCATCHLGSAGIQRTSQSACLSCHRSYPADHVATYGPIESPFVGGGEASLLQCTSSCHTTHPGSGL